MMPAFLIVLAIAAFGVAIVLWATRRRPHAQPAAGERAPVQPDAEPVMAFEQAATDPFAGAPLPASTEALETRA
jgi:hypothetical protein